MKNILTIGHINMTLILIVVAVQVIWLFAERKQEAKIDKAETEFKENSLLHKRFPSNYDKIAKRNKQTYVLLNLACSSIVLLTAFNNTFDYDLTPTFFMLAEILIPFSSLRDYHLRKRILDNQLQEESK